MDNKKRFFQLANVIMICIILCLSVDLIAQCPMCRSAAESNLKAGGSNGRGLNAGILYMLSMPYVLLMTIGLLWYRHHRTLAKNAE